MGQSRQIMFDLSPRIFLRSSRRGSQPPQGIMAPRRDLSADKMGGLNSTAHEHQRTASEAQSAKGRSRPRSGLILPFGLCASG